MREESEIISYEKVLPEAANMRIQLLHFLEPAQR